MNDRILLINPPIEDFYQTKIRQEPLGLEYLAAYLRAHHYTVHILDALNKDNKKTISIPQKLSYLKKYYPVGDISPFKLYGHYKHFGMDDSDIKNHVLTFKPHYIGISSNFTPYFDYALNTAKICKNVYPDVPVIMGGHHVTAAPESALNSGYVDYIILGEGEFTFLKLLNILKHQHYDKLNSFSGIAFRKLDQIQIYPVQEFIANLDELPVPRNVQYFQSKMILTSRGCPRNCNFCSIEKVMGKRIRLRSVESVIQEITLAIKSGITTIDFEDDTLTFNKKHAIQLFNALIHHFGERDITFSARNGIDANTLDEELIRLIKNAGFRWLNLPLVSGSQQIQNQLSRNQSHTHFSNIIKLAAHYHLKITAYLIIGLPEDNPLRLLDDIIYLATQQVLLGPSIFYPPPGTQTFENCVNRGYIDREDYLKFRSTALAVTTEHFSRNDLITLFRLCRVINYLKYLIDKKQISSFQTFSDSVITFSDNMNTTHKLDSLEIGQILLHQLFQNGKLRGLKLKQPKNVHYQYEWIEYAQSPQIIERFIKLINMKKIRGVETNHFTSPSIK